MSAAIWLLVLEMNDNDLDKNLFPRSSGKDCRNLILSINTQASSIILMLEMLIN